MSLAPEPDKLSPLESNGKEESELVPSIFRIASFFHGRLHAAATTHQGKYSDNKLCNLIGEVYRFNFFSVPTPGTWKTDFCCQPVLNRVHGEEMGKAYAI